MDDSGNFSDDSGKWTNFKLIHTSTSLFIRMPFIEKMDYLFKNDFVYIVYYKVIIKATLDGDL